MQAKKYVMISVLFSTLLMCFVDGVIVPPYLYKSLIKIVLFLIVPIIYFVLYKDKSDYYKNSGIDRRKR